jgi:hypothetical protein
MQLPILPPAPTLKAVNDVPLTRKLLEQALTDLSERLYRSFRRQVRLVVHGGAVMVLHKSFNHRESTQDIDYIHRSFVSEYTALGFSDAEQRLRSCITETARRFNFGADWMNDHADVALPLALECVKMTPFHHLFLKRFPPKNNTLCLCCVWRVSFFVFPTLAVNKCGRTIPSSTLQRSRKTQAPKRFSTRPVSPS